MTKIGDTLWRQPRGYSAPEIWIAYKITGETRDTWELDNINPGSRTRLDNVNKKTLLTPKDRQGYQDRYFTPAGKLNKLFCDKHARDIGHAVSACGDASKLRQIADMVGKSLKE